MWQSSSFKFPCFPFPLHKLSIIFLSLFNSRTKLLSCSIKKGTPVLNFTSSENRTAATDVSAKSIKEDPLLEGMCPWNYLALSLSGSRGEGGKRGITLFTVPGEMRIGCGGEMSFLFVLPPLPPILPSPSPNACVCLKQICLSKTGLELPPVLGLGLGGPGVELGCLLIFIFIRNGRLHKKSCWASRYKSNFGFAFQDKTNQRLRGKELPKHWTPLPLSVLPSHPLSLPPLLTVRPLSREEALKQP